MAETPEGFDLDQVRRDWWAARFERGIATYEAVLAAMEPRTPFHAILGRNFLGQRDQAIRWLTDAYDQALQQTLAEREGEEFEEEDEEDSEDREPIIGMCAEMNRFEINTDAWFFTAFAYDGLVEEELEDLGMFFYSSEELVLTGMEDIQAAMAGADTFADELESAPACAGTLVTTHALHLIAEAYRAIRQTDHPLGRIPFFACIHDDPFVYDGQRDRIEEWVCPGSLESRIDPEDYA